MFQLNKTCFSLLLDVQKNFELFLQNSIFIQKQTKNINQRNIRRLHQRSFAVIPVACEFLNDRSSPATKR